MTERVCQIPGCDQPLPVGDNSTACPACWTDLLNHLAQVPALVDELNTTITRQTAVAGRSGPKTSETPLPYHPAASDALRCLESRLNATLAAADPTEPRQPAGNAPQTALKLIRRLPQLRNRDDAHTHITQLNQAIRDSWRIIDRPADLVYQGPCGATLDGVTCTADLWAKPGDPWARCRICGATFDTGERSRWFIEALRPTLVSAREACHLIAVHGEGNIRQEQISRWKARGMLQPRQHDPATGVEMFLLGDLIDLVQNVKLGRPRLDKPKSA